MKEKRRVCHHNFDVKSGLKNSEVFQTNIKDIERVTRRRHKLIGSEEIDLK